MLTQLSTIKARLGIDDFDVSHDALLANFIEAASATFEKYCNRQFGREVDFAQEFPADNSEIILVKYPVESVTKFQLKQNETDGWVDQAAPDYLIRSACVVSLEEPLGSCRELARILYTGGYVLPGATPGTGQQALPADLEQAAVEQVAAWYQNRDKLGLVRYWPKGGIYLEFVQSDMLISVRAVLERYKRISL